MEIYKLVHKTYNCNINNNNNKSLIGGDSNNSIFDSSKTYFEHFDQIESLINEVSNDELYKLIDELLVNFSKNKFNDIIESLVYLYCSHQSNFMKRFRISDLKNVKVYYIMFKYYPYLIYSLMYHQTINEQLKFVKELDKIDAIQNLRIEKYTDNLNKYKSYLENYYSSFDTNSICINFNNFIGIKFKSTGINYNEIPKNGLIVYVGFNNTFDNVLYKHYSGIKSNFLNYEDIIKFKIFEQVKTYSSEICYSIYENGKITFSKSKSKDHKDQTKFKKISENINLNNEEYYIIICYNDSPKFEECHFSVSESSYSKRNIEVLTNGGLINSLPLSVYKLYLSKMFYIRKNVMKDVEDNSDSVITATQELKAKISKLIKPCFSVNYKKCIDKWTREFPNDKYLKIYLQGLRNYRDIETGKLDFNKYYEFVKIYFFPVIN